MNSEPERKIASQSWPSNERAKYLKNFALELETIKSKKETRKSDAYKVQDAHRGTDGQGARWRRWPSGC